ncbi:hypothetical protein [Methylomonas fluvii]|uniref:Uncharacterized protein n=1 Tax=Methylomonas fluvii TaxID=1854564 RepID=A0ABR9D8D1_9GAMM|nr:hypothetical protein [Methylomonas fluvii]MBD9359359.1 hypothetical protein [Methylomonas fluvii]
MSSTEAIDLNDWFSRWDMEAVPDLDDKVKECEFFFDALSTQTNRNSFRWLVSAFLNAAYSFFESTALTAYFRFTDPESGESYEDHEGLAILRRHVKVEQNAKKPNFVKTAGLTPLTKQLYEFRKKNTHHFPLSIMAIGTTLPEDFHFGSMRDEGVPVMPLCREVLTLIRAVYAEIND